MKPKIDESLITNFLNTINNINEINDNSIIELEKDLFELVRDGLKKNEVSLDIAPYKLNIDPKNIEVVYKEYIKFPMKADNNTVVDNISYYLIRPTKERNILYSSFNPIIRLKNIIAVQDGIPRELLNIELLNGEEYNLKDYVEDSLNENVVGNKTTVSFNINQEDDRINFEKYLIMNDLLPVYYEKETDSYLALNGEVVKDPYDKVISDINKNKVMVKAIYDSLVKFFEKYV